MTRLSILILAVLCATTRSMAEDWSSPPIVLADDLITTKPTTAPDPTGESGIKRSIGEFIGHFTPYEPMYVVFGDSPLAKFQFSFKYRIFNEDAPLGKVPLLGGLHFSYTQLSLWELGQPSAPFFDTNYQPEFFYANDDVKSVGLPAVSQLGLAAGYWHDSNGQAGVNSRSINMLFIRPTFTFGDPDHFHGYVSPKIYTYIGDLSDNPDIYHYRGYCDLRGVIGWRHGLELSAIGRVGSHWNRGGVQLDLSYPLRDLLFKNFDVYLDVQLYYGYGESLLTYNQRTNAVRFGLLLVR